LHAIDLFNQQENRERDDQKVDNSIEKDSIVEGRRARSFGRGHSWVIAPGEVDEQVREINIAEGQSTLPRASPMGGMSTSSTNEVTIFPKAAPITIPIARSTTLPRITNSLNSFSIFDPLFFQLSRLAEVLRK
jgi:hypothetical protein